MTPATDIDLLLLALVQRGLRTPYDFKVKAGLSVGTTAPVLDRLEKDGWITAEKPGSRGSKPFSITKAGAKKLAKEWRDLLRRRPTSIDEILRILYLSRVLGNAPLAVRFATQATADLEALREMKRLEACQYDPGLGSSSRADWYRSLKLRSQAAEAEAQAHLLSDVAGELLGAKRSKKKR